MIDINKSLRQLRNARHLGKISNEVQTRVLRRHAPRQSVLRWEAMMKLRAAIERDIAPVMKARRAVEWECFQIKFRVESASKQAIRIVKVTPCKVRKELTGYEYTRAWWDEQELKERADRKADKAAAKLALA